MTKSAEFSEERIMWPYQFLRQAFLLQLEEAERRYNFGDQSSSEFDPRKVEGWRQFKASGLVFMFLWFEAYLNYALSELYDVEYPLLERKPPLEKCKMLLKKFNLQKDLTEIKKLKSFRDALAHGKEHKYGPQMQEMPLDDFHEYDADCSNLFFGEADWEKSLHDTDAEEVQKYILDILNAIKDAAGLKWPADGLSDLRSRSAGVKV